MCHIRSLLLILIWLFCSAFISKCWQLICMLFETFLPLFSKHRWKDFLNLSSFLTFWFFCSYQERSWIQSSIVLIIWLNALIIPVLLLNRTNFDLPRIRVFEQLVGYALCNCFCWTDFVDWNENCQRSDVENLMKRRTLMLLGSYRMGSAYVRLLLTWDWIGWLTYRKVLRFHESVDGEDFILILESLRNGSYFQWWYKNLKNSINQWCAIPRKLIINFYFFSSFFIYSRLLSLSNIHFKTFFIFDVDLVEDLAATNFLWKNTFGMISNSNSFLQTK